jgi:hypothetical protein
MYPQYAVSVITLLTYPELILGVSLRRVRRKCENLGCALQMLPIKGVNLRTLRCVDGYVVTVNGDPWNHGNLLEVLRRYRMERRGIKISPENEPPKLEDYLLFGVTWEPIARRLEALKQAFPEALFIRHKHVDGAAIELCPEMVLSVAKDRQVPFEEALNYLLFETDVPLCLDSKHLRREDRYGYGQRICDDPVQFLSGLEPIRERIVAIHFNPDSPEELHQWLDKKVSDTPFALFFQKLALMLSTEMRAVPIVIELHPNLKKHIPAIRQKLESLFGLSWAYPGDMLFPRVEGAFSTPVALSFEVARAFNQMLQIRSQTGVWPDTTICVGGNTLLTPEQIAKSLNQTL